MARKIIINRKHGVSLVELLVVLGIISVVIGAMMTLASNQNKEMQAMTQKMAALDLQKTLITLTSTEDICSRAITEAIAAGSTEFSFPTASPPPADTRIEMQSLYQDATSTTAVVRTGELFNSIITQLTIGDIYLSNLNLSGSSAVADLFVEIDGGVRSLKPLVTRVRLSTSIVGPTTSITGCPGLNPTAPNLVIDISDTTSDSGVRTVNLSRPGLIIATARGYALTQNNTFARVMLNGAVCAQNRSIFLDWTTHKYASATCTQYVPAGTYNIQAYCLDCSTSQRGWTIQALEM